MEDSQMAKELFDVEKAAYMTRLTVSSFRVKVSRLGIKGVKQGVKVFYTRKQLEDVYKGISHKAVKKTTKKVSKKRVK
jgi:hypothetical protein